jgi:hypothetical protein
MPGLIFGIKYKSTKIPNIKKLIKNDAFTMNSDYDRLIQHCYHKSLLRFYLRIAKENQGSSFLLRIYPYERPYLKYYLRLIKNIKNLKISSEGTIFDDFQKTYLVITTCDNVSLEASILGIKTYVYKRNKILHNYLFGDHLFLKIYPNNVINKKNYGYIINNLDTNYEAENNYLKELYGLNLDSSRIIAREIVMNEDIKYNFFIRIKNTFIYYLLMFFIKKIFFYISIDKKNNYYNLLAFNNFKKKFKYSLTRIFFYLLFYDLKNMRHDVHNVIYKYLLGKNYHESSIKLHNSSSFNIDINYVLSLLKSFNSIDVKKLSLSLNPEKNILIIKKIS